MPLYAPKKQPLQLPRTSFLGLSSFPVQTPPEISRVSPMGPAEIPIQIFPKNLGEVFASICFCHLNHNWLINLELLVVLFLRPYSQVFNRPQTTPPSLDCPTGMEEEWRRVQGNWSRASWADSWTTISTSWIIYWLVVSTPLEKYESIWMTIPNIWKNRKCSKPPTSIILNI